MQLKPFALILMLTAGFCVACPHPNHAQTTAPTKPPVLPDAFSIYGDSLEAARKGLLAYSVAPLSEPQLRLRDRTPQEFSATLPLIINKAQTNLSVMAHIDNTPVLLSLDTGGGAGILLDKKTAKRIFLEHPHLVSLTGVSGMETATEGIAHNLTLGSLTLRAVDTAVPHHFVDLDAPCILGTPMLSRYRLTLDLTARTMTLSRGGAPEAAENNEASIALPFRSDYGKIYLPCYIAGRLTWSQVDSGSPLNFLSLRTAKAAAAQISAQETKSVTTHLKAGLGDTYKTTSVVLLKRLVPISLDSEDTPRAFGTTSQVGMSTYNEDDPTPSGIQSEALLGVPFLLQFHRVIIDYPSHMLTLQGLKHGAPRNLYAKLLSYGKPWPGYRWQATGDGSIEVPDKTAAASAATTTNVTQTTTTANGVIITMSGPLNAATSGSTVIVNGVKYDCPTGSVLTVGADGKAVITPFSSMKTAPSVSVSQNNIRGNGNTVNGSNNAVSGDDNHVSGSSNTVNGNKSTIHGSNNALQGNGSTISGSDNALNGDADTITGSNDSVNSSSSTVIGSNQTLSKPHAMSPPTVASARKININTVNGVKYRSPVGSLLTVDADGTAHITLSSP